MCMGPDAGKRNVYNACMTGQWQLIESSEANLDKSQRQDHEGLMGKACEDFGTFEQKALRALGDVVLIFLRHEICIAAETRTKLWLVQSLYVARVWKGSGD